MRFTFGNFLTVLARPFRAAARALHGAQPTNGVPDTALDKALVLRVKQPRSFPTGKQFAKLPKLLRKWERVTLGIALIVFVAAAATLVSKVAAHYRVLVPESGGEYIEALVGSPRLVNPWWASANAADRDLVRLVYAGLFAYTPSLELVPDLAASYEISDDGKTYIIRLKPNLRWHDGEPLTSSDVVFTISSIQNPAMKSSLARDFEGASATATDPETITFTIESPSALFLHALTVGILPEHLWADVPAENAPLAEFNTKPIGAGPFRFKTLRKTKQGAVHSYVLLRNEAYHGEQSYLKTIVLKFFPDYQTAVHALSRGNVDGLGFVPHELREGLTRRRDLVYHRIDLPQITALFWNQKRNALLTEKPVREALAQAVDRNAILETAFHGEGTVISGPILPGFTGYTSEVPVYAFDMNRAREILEAEGWKFEEGGTVRTFVPRDKKDKRFVANTALRVELATVNVAEYVRAAELVRDAWSALGLEVKLTIVEPSAIERDLITPRAYDALLYGEIIGPDPDPFPFWHSSQINPPGVNLAGYANRRVDALLLEARALRDEAERARRYDEFQKTVVAELPAIFLLSPSYTYVIDRRVRGVEIGRLGSPADRFAGVTNWYVRMRSKFK